MLLNCFKLSGIVRCLEQIISRSQIWSGIDFWLAKVSAINYPNVSQVVYCFEQMMAVFFFSNSSYVVVAPSKFRAGMDFTVSVNVLKATDDVSVNAYIVRTNDNSRVASATATLRQGTYLVYVLINLHTNY